jgi:hypothetical protein
LWIVDAEGNRPLGDLSHVKKHPFARAFKRSKGVRSCVTYVRQPATVVNLTLSNLPRPMIEIEFSEPMDVQRLIDDGSILDSVTLIHVPHGPIQLAAGQFTYDGPANKLRWTYAGALPVGYYEFRIDGTQVTSDDGAWLRGDRSGLVFETGTWDAGEILQADGDELAVDGFSVPSLADWNGDGLLDLIVGERTADGEGKVRVYLNQGTSEVPVFGEFFYAQTATGDLAVPAGGGPGEDDDDDCPTCPPTGLSGASGESCGTSTCGTGCAAPLSGFSLAAMTECRGLGVAPRLFDWNGDGLLDLVLGLADGHVQVALNENADGDPQFSPPQHVLVGEPDAKTNLNVGGCATLEIVDWNNDGLPDLLVGGMDGRIRLYLNEGTLDSPDFRTVVFLQDGGHDLLVSTGGASVAVADLNGDGRKDLIVGDTTGGLRYYANIGTDSAPAFDGWQPILADGVEINGTGFWQSRPFVGDINDDGIPDLLVGANDGVVRLYTGLTPGGPTELSEPLIGFADLPYIHTFEVDFYTNLPPSVGALTASPAWIVRSDALTLTAVEVHDPDGTVTQVEFYRGETPLGTDDDGHDGWSLTIDTTGWALGEYTLYARAQDNDGAWSEKTPLTARIYAALQALDFGVVPVFNARERTWALHNDGTEILVVQASDLDLPFAIRPTAGAGENGDWILLPGATTTFVVSYRPNEDGSHRTALTAIGQADGRLSHLTGLAYSGHQNPLNHLRRERRRPCHSAGCVVADQRDQPGCRDGRAFAADG